MATRKRKAQEHCYQPTFATMESHEFATMEIHEFYGLALIGVSGAQIFYIRTVSGAKITFERSSHKVDHMTISIVGTNQQIQAAIRMIENVVAMADAAQSCGSYNLYVEGYDPYKFSNP